MKASPQLSSQDNLFCQVELERSILYQKAWQKKRELKTQIDEYNRLNPPPLNPFDEESFSKT